MQLIYRRIKEAFGFFEIGDTTLYQQGGERLTGVDGIFEVEYRLPGWFFLDQPTFFLHDPNVAIPIWNRLLEVHLFDTQHGAF